MECQTVSQVNKHQTEDEELAGQGTLSKAWGKCCGYHLHMIQDQRASCEHQSLEEAQGQEATGHVQSAT